MEDSGDSPLSVASSITGILTFIAALCASVYLRYNALQNGETEINHIIASVLATIEETQSISQTEPAMRRNDESSSTRLEKLVAELYKTELFIIAQCMNVHNTSLSTFRSSWTLPSWGPTNSPWDSVLQEVEKMQKESQPQPRRKTGGFMDSIIQQLKLIDSLVPQSRTLGLAWGAAKFVLLAGATPTLIRWYMVREKVLEKIQHREMIRSRLLFHQVIVVNRSVYILAIYSAY
jgi:hypothetical protein